MTERAPCPRCQLAGPHADADECVGALLVVLRMREQELVWLRHYREAVDAVYPQDKQHVWLVYRSTHDGRDIRAIALTLARGKLAAAIEAGRMLVWSDYGIDHGAVADWGGEDEWRVERWSVVA